MVKTLFIIIKTMSEKNNNSLGAKIGGVVVVLLIIILAFWLYPSSPKLITINNTSLSQQEVSDFIDSLGILDQVSEAEQAQVREQITAELVPQFGLLTVLSLEADKQGVIVDPNKIAQTKVELEQISSANNLTPNYIIMNLKNLPLEKAIENFLKQNALMSKVMSSIAVDETGVAQAYAEITANNEKIIANNAIVAERKIAALEEIKQIKAELDSGKTFTEISAGLSADCSNENICAQDLGTFGKGLMVQSFEDAVFAQGKLGVGDIIETDFGYHLVDITDIGTDENGSPVITATHILATVPAEQQINYMTEDDIRDQLRLQDSTVQKVQTDFIKSIIADYDIETLKPEYDFRSSLSDTIDLNTEVVEIVE